MQVLSISRKCLARNAEQAPSAKGSPAPGKLLCPLPSKPQRGDTCSLAITLRQVALTPARSVSRTCKPRACHDASGGFGVEGERGRSEPSAVGRHLRAAAMVRPERGRTPLAQSSVACDHNHRMVMAQHGAAGPRLVMDKSARRTRRRTPRNRRRRRVRRWSDPRGRRAASTGRRSPVGCTRRRTPQSRNRPPTNRR